MTHARPACRDGAGTRRSLMVLVLLIAGAVGGCDTMKRAGSAVFGSESEPARKDAASEPAGPGLEAPLRPVNGTAAQGSVRFTPRGDGVTMLVAVSGLAPGQYRVLVHANGNCTSPNGFSAGPPWPGPAGAKMLDRVPLLTTNSEGTASLTVRLNGVKLEGPDGLRGRSVVVHEATGSLEAQPDVPNQRIACGVIGPLTSIF